MNKEVLIYTKSYCPYCKKAKKLLEEKSVEYKEIEILEHPEQKEVMELKSNGRTTVPQIFIGEIHVGGCDDLFVLQSKGELDKLLEL